MSDFCEITERFEALQEVDEARAVMYYALKAVRDTVAEYSPNGTVLLGIIRRELEEQKFGEEVVNIFYEDFFTEGESNERKPRVPRV